MIKFELLPFPQPRAYERNPDSLNIRIIGGLVKQDDCIQCNFLVEGEIKNIVWPSLQSKSSPGNELWKHTCFEIFVGAMQSEEYWEYNFSPSRHWSVFAFDSYRKLNNTQRMITPEVTSADFSANTFSLQCDAPLSPTLRNRALEIAVSTVIETTHGEKYYFALTHCGDRPDFHRRDSFILKL